MRKQTKLVAVLSTAALLAIGASATSFAATGWTEENGTWVYYDKNGDQVTEEWQKSGEHWYWLDENGEMAVDQLIEDDDDDYYYVNEYGTMVRNRWVSIENDDYDGDDEDEPMVHWYYFGSNGKAYQNSGDSASFKTINGEKYIFDDEGKMLYGWINENGDRETGDEDWQDGVYYCGDENDGAQKRGEWAYLEITDSAYDSDEAGKSSSNVFDDEEQERWFYFKTNGKKITNEKGKTINGKKYSFDEWGRMNAEWVVYNASPSIASQGDASYTSNFRYYGDPEDGARVTKGWFQVVPDENLNKDDYDDDDNAWYYSDKDGKLVAGELKSIDGKKYAFDGYGAMKTGLRAIKFEGTGNKEIVEIFDWDDKAAYQFDTEDEFKENVSKLYNDGYTLYYFDSDGVMKTGKQTIKIDGDEFSFLFNKSGSTKGQGKMGMDDDKYYLGGMLMEADNDDKYEVVKAVKTGDKYTEITMLSVEEFLDEMGATSEIPAGKEDDYEEYYDVKAAAADSEVEEDGVTIKTTYRLVNTAGTIQEGKSKAKDGDDNCYKVASNGEIVAVFVED